MATHSQGGRGRGQGAGGGGGPAARPGGRPGPARGPGLGRGRKRHRRHRRLGIQIRPFHFPAHRHTAPTVEGVTAHLKGSTAVIILHGYGFNSIPGNAVYVEYKTTAKQSPQIREFRITSRDDASIEVRMKFSKHGASGLEILAMAYSAIHGELVLLTGPFSVSKKADQSSGSRVFGVPGIPAGMPGWGGNAGVAQSPHPGPTGPAGVQTYGSLGYGSMGDGSMDEAVRQGRRRR